MKYIKSGILKELARWQLYSLVIGCVLSLIQRESYLQILGVSLVMTNSIAASIYFLHRFSERRLVYNRKKWRLKFIQLGVVVLVGSVFGTYIGVNLVGFLFDAQLASYMKNNFVTFLYFCLFISVVIMTLEMVLENLKEKIARQVQENEELKHLQVRTQLMALQSKINPHFLFNTLNAMVSLVHREPQKVETMILNLSGIYRRVLQVPEDGRVPLGEEIELIKKYLDIEKIRLGDRLSYEVDMESPLERVEIPPLLIEPLVENAVIHGIGPKSGGGKITVDAGLGGNGKTIIIKVTDNGVGPGEQVNQISGGFGLYSVQERLRLLYKDAARMRIAAEPGGGTAITMELPNEQDDQDRHR
jgi:two-component system, LytTR family, sensor kinase